MNRSCAWVGRVAVVIALFACRGAARAAQEPVPIPGESFNASCSLDGAPGWFRRGEGAYDPGALPGGHRTLAGVTWDVPQGRTLMLAGAGAAVEANEVRGIPVGRRAEVLYFLHAHNPGPALAQWQQKDRDAKAAGERPLEPPTLFRYVLHYADGESLTVNVRWDESVNDWLRAGEYADPPYAATAWTQTVSKDWVLDRWPRKGLRVVLYAMRYENPRPDEEVATVDVVSANDAAHDWGAPAVLAVSTGTREYPGTTYYVAPGGSDDAPGTFEEPWATPYKAAETLQEGDTAYLRGGHYKLRQDWRQMIVVRYSGSQSAPITFAAYPGETAVIDGYDHHCAHDTRVPYAIYDRDEGLFNIFEKMNVTVRNLRVENSRKSGFGIYQSRRILMDHNVVYGTKHCAMNTASNTDLRIIGNTLGQNCSAYYHWDTETQEWTPWKPGTGRAPKAGREGIDNHRNEYTEIAFNEIYWCGKEAIADPSRHFKIHHNYIHHLPHTPETYWPSGIYLDAYGPIMDDLDVYDNVIHNAASGVTIGSEGGTTGTDIRVHHNLIFNNTWEGIGINSAGNNGLREGIVIENNTILNCGHTDWEKGPTGGICIATTNCRDVTVRYNILAGNRDYQVSVHSEVDRIGQGIAVHDNLYDPVFLPTERVRARIRGWIPVVSDRLVWGEPGFVDAEAWDFTLRPDSPAVDVIRDRKDEDGTPGDLGAFAHLFNLPPPPPAGEGFVFRVNCGAEKPYVDSQGNTWQADRRYREGAWGATWSGTVRRDPRDVANTQDDEIYLTERYRMEQYRFHVPNGQYSVRLHFAETFNDEPGQRNFSVLLNGRAVLEDFDPTTAAGGKAFAAVAREFETKVFRGELVLEFRGQGTMINGIEIIQLTQGTG